MNDVPPSPRAFRAPATVPMPWRRRLEAIVRGPVQVAVWLGFGVFGVLLAGRGPAAGPMRGLVRAPEALVVAARDGLLVEVLVREGDVVTAGDVVARMDTLEHDTALDLARGDAAVAAAEVEAAAAEEALFELERAHAAEERRVGSLEGLQRAGLDEAANVLRGSDQALRLAAELRDRRLETARLDVVLAAGRVALTRARQESERAANLAGAGIDRRATAEDLALVVAELEAELAANEALRAVAASQADETERALAVLGGVAAGEPPALGTLSALEGELAARGAAAGRARVRALERVAAAAEATVARLEAGRDALELVAPIGGRVVSVLAWPGAALIAGAPALVLRADVATDAVVYLDEASAASAPHTVSLARAADPRRAVTARVVRLGAGVEELPLALRRLPSQPEYGRPVYIELPKAMQLMPGERLRARAVSNPASPEQP